MSYTIGVDIGTTSLKAVLYDEKLRVLASANEEYPTYHPAPGLAEQDPEEIYLAFRRAILSLMRHPGKREGTTTLVFSSAMHAVIAVNEAGLPLTRTIIWADNRAEEIIAALKRQSDWLHFYHKTGTPVHPMSPFAKLLWLKENTDLLERAAKFIGIKEYLFHRLTGEYVVDYSIASATGLFNIHKMAWDREILGMLDLKEGQLSRPVPVTAAFSFREPEMAAEIGLDRHTRLVIGASDGCLANLGTNAIGSRETTLTIGTSGAVRMTVSEPLLDPAGRTFCYYLAPGKWVIGGAVNNGGNVLKWLNDILYRADDRIYEELPELLAATSPGAEQLFFFPYLNGERAPFWDGSLRGTYHGLSVFHTKAHLVRAALEGVLFNLAEVWQLVQELGGASTSVKASGGFLNSPQWAQMTADIFGLPLQTAAAFESSCLGAALLAQPDPGEVCFSFPQEDRIEPQPEVQEQYRRLFRRYCWYSRKLQELAHEESQP